MTILGTDSNHRGMAAFAHSTGRVGLVLVFTFALAIGFALNQSGGVAQAAPPAATAPTLGAAAGFTVLAGTAVTCTDSSVTGDVGIFPGTAYAPVRCIVTGTVHAGDTSAEAAYNDFLDAYDALAFVGCDSVLTGTLAGLTLSPGVYCFDAAATVTGVLTLDGPTNGIWIFKIGTGGTGALTGTGFSMVMAGGGQPCNVYWRVAEAATMTDSDFAGTILAGAAITITRGTFAGNAFAKAAVTMTGTNLVGCGFDLAAQAQVCLRVAGKSWNSVRLDLFQDDVLIGSVSVTRIPGSPNEQTECIALEVDITACHAYRAEVTFEPKPGAKKGANSVWILILPEGAKVDPGHALLKFHHVFEVKKHSKYVWKVPLTGLASKLTGLCGCEEEDDDDQDGHGHDHDGRDADRNRHHRDRDCGDDDDDHGGHDGGRDHERDGCKDDRDRSGSYERRGTTAAGAVPVTAAGTTAGTDAWTPWGTAAATPDGTPAPATGAD